jgi:hypothetical protein
MWGPLSDERMGLSFAIAADSRQHSPSPPGPMTIFISLFQDSHNLEGQVSIFISPRNRVAQLYPQALVSFLSTPMTHRATVEVFEPTSTRAHTPLSPLGIMEEITEKRKKMYQKLIPKLKFISL